MDGRINVDCKIAVELSGLETVSSTSIIVAVANCCAEGRIIESRHGFGNQTINRDSKHPGDAVRESAVTLHKAGLALQFDDCNTGENDTCTIRSTT